MAKKQKIVDLKRENINFNEGDKLIKVLLLKCTNMTVELALYQNDVFIENQSRAFAQLPKNVKQKIKPV